MRLLVLTPVAPFPAQNGVQIRIGNLLRRLPEGIHLELLSFDTVSEVRSEPLPLPLNGTLTRCPVPRSPGGWRGSQLAQLLRPDPSLIWKFRSGQFARLVRSKSGGVDGVLAVGLQIAQYLDQVPSGTPTILDNYNVESRILERLAETRTGLKRLFWRGEAAKVARAERRALLRAGGVFAISDVDREGMRALAPSANLATVSMGVDLDYFCPPAGARMSQVLQVPRFAFVGAFNWHVNEDAAVWLCTEVWPLVRKSLPDAELYLVGREPSPIVQGLAVPGSVIVTGTVPDVRPYLWASAATLVPLRYGSGVRTKILEAFACGRPVVSTTIGCEGLAVCDGQHLLIRDHADAFAEACLRLARSTADAEFLSEQARQLVLELDRMATVQFRVALQSAFKFAADEPQVPSA